ncbi:MAG: hypothetical protein ACI4IV_04930 [Acutalibacteraceae bacterium]
MIDKTGEEAAQGFANRGVDLSFGLLLFGRNMFGGFLLTLLKNKQLFVITA